MTGTIQPHRPRPRVRLVVLFLAIALATVAVPARANIVSQCANSTVTEGQLGSVLCTATNFGPNPVVITGVFAFSYVLGGDATDRIVRVSVLGPFPNPGNPVQFQVLLNTPNDGPEPNPDFGLNDVSLILRAKDQVTGAFVPGTYGSAAVSVFDVGLAPIVPTTQIPNTHIDSSSDFDAAMFNAISRGAVTNLPEPRPLALVAIAGVALIAVRRGRPARVTRT